MHVVLINPEIPWNAGNIGRTCVAAGATLHLVGKLGFKIDSREIRRAGLDYWPLLKYERHKDFAGFLKKIPPGASIIFFSTKGRRSFWEAPYTRGSYLVFGSESGGLPEDLYTTYADSLYRIPTTGDVRSLNLSTAAAIVLYEAIRQTSLDILFQSS